MILKNKSENAHNIKLSEIKQGMYKLGKEIIDRFYILLLLNPQKVMQLSKEEKEKIIN